MTTGQNDQITLGHQLPCPFCIAAIKDMIGAEVNTGMGKCHKNIRTDTAGKIMGIRVCTNKQAAHIPCQSPANTI